MRIIHVTGFWNFVKLILFFLFSKYLFTKILRARENAQSFIAGGPDRLVRSREKYLAFYQLFVTIRQNVRVHIIILDWTFSGDVCSYRRVSQTVKRRIHGELNLWTTGLIVKYILANHDWGRRFKYFVEILQKGWKFQIWNVLNSPSYRIRFIVKKKNP